MPLAIIYLAEYLPIAGIYHMHDDRMKNGPGTGQ